MTDVTLITVLGLGLVLGLRHALDPDHLAAISTIVSESKSLRRSTLVGTFWGLGHTLDLLLAGVLVIALKFQISARIAVWMEFVVALMLILLGIKSLLRSLRGLKVHIHRHRHDGTEHVHVHLQDTSTPFFGEGIPFYFHGYRVAGVEMERGMPLGGRVRRSRRWPGAFIGDTVEQVTSVKGSALDIPAEPLPA